ncbi:MAG: hypothetical protein HS116_01895 [Planctomycetes bacterium]|nr:hypothetical protein [Planctomycetota bacterium]
MRRRVRHASVFALLAALAACGPAPDAGTSNDDPAALGVPLVREAEKGPVKLRLELRPAQPRLSDTVRLLLEVRAAPEVEIEPPAFAKSMGEFLISDFHEAAAGLDDGVPVRRFHYELEPTQAGPHLIRELSVTFVDRRAVSEAKDARGEVALDPIQVDVTSEFASGAPDLAQLEPMRDPVALPVPPSRWAWIVAGALGVLALTGLLLYLRRRRHALEAAAPRLSPEEIAHEALRLLRERRLPEQGQFAEFYVELTAIVRRYVELRTAIHAPEQTTEEFLRAMRADVRFDPGQRERLRLFLEASDLVKYAAQRPRAEEIEDAFDRAQQFVGLGGQGLLRTEPTPELAEAGGAAR